MAPNSNAVKPGTLTGDRIEARLNFAESTTRREPTQMVSQ
jgi:hypothetical protein